MSLQAQLHAPEEAEGATRTARLLQSGGSRAVRLPAELRFSGDVDELIAARALAMGAVLVTGHVRHFRRVPGLVVEDWVLR